MNHDHHLHPRVLMIISLFYPMRGGAEQQAIQLAWALAQAGIKVSVLTRKLPGLPSVERINGVVVYRKIVTVDIGKLFGLLYAVSVFLFLLIHIRHYDIIHCHLAQGFHSPVALFFKFFFGKRVIIKIGATGPLSDFLLLRNTFGGRIFVKMLKYTDRIIVVCKQAYAEALRNGIPQKKIELIPNCVDCTKFIPAPPGERKHGYITFVGRLDTMKGVHILLEAFAQLKDKWRAAQLRIVGDGPEKANLINLARRLHIDDVVQFYGEQNDVHTFLKESYLFVLPSLSEGLPNALLEAMACGLPVIATRVGGTVDIIRDEENGLLVEPGDTRQLAGALSRLLEDQALAGRLGIAARQTMLDNFSIGTMICSYRNVYRCVMSTKGKRTFFIKKG